MTGRIDLTCEIEDAFIAARQTLLRYLQARGAADDAEDIVQELWLRLAKARPATGQVGAPYLLRMAHNLLVDRHRTRSRREAREAAYQAMVPDATPSGEDAADARDRLQEVDRTLDALGQRTDHIFRRHRVDCIPQREIADETGISLSAVEKHLQKAYRAIAALALRDRQ